MKISILTTITSPEERQDKWREALACYCDLADEVIVVNGGKSLTNEKAIPNIADALSLYLDSNEKIKIIDLEWPYEWNWIELPRHLNAGREQCTGDFIIKLDIDQFFHEKDFAQIRNTLENGCHACWGATFQKMSMAYGGKHYQKGEQLIAYRNRPDIAIGKDLNKETDLCFPIIKTGTEVINGYELPVGGTIHPFKTGITYWNYDYFFKTRVFTQKEFWRFSRAYHRYYKTWKFGDTEEASFNIFLNMMKARYNGAPYTTKMEEHPKYIRKAVEELKPEQCGFNLWGL